MLIAGEETESAGEIERFGRNCIDEAVSPLALPFFFACFLCLCMLQTKRPTDQDNFELPR